MSFISQQDKVFRRLRDFLDLQTYYREKVVVPSMILPTFPVDTLLDDLAPIAEVQATATNNMAAFEVPYGKRWTLVGYYVDRDHAGPLSVWVQDRDNKTFVINGHASAESHNYLMLPPLVLDEGWEIVLLNSAGTSGVITSRIMYREADIF
jgi:hypothetical protein